MAKKKAKATYNTTTMRIYVEHAADQAEATKLAESLMFRNGWDDMELMFLFHVELNGSWYYIFDLK